jgi:hypothetical protein
LERSSSFHKCLGAFEAGRKVSDDDDFSDNDSDDDSDDDDDVRRASRRSRLPSSNAGSQKSLIQAELEEIRFAAKTF